MSKVIVKVKYHNPKSSSKNISGYANYIATREGVEKIEPETTYADYIATRPGVEKKGTHGLFSIEDRPVSLRKVSEELKNYQGNVWTVIVSLKGEDAEKTGYDNGEAWRELISDKANDIAKDFCIPIDQLNCYAAFHNEKSHPHIHMIVYSKNPEVYGGYHNENSMQKLKSVFTREIFREELSEIYKVKDEYRNALKSESYEKVFEITQDLRNNRMISSEVSDAFLKFAESLKGYKGRKSYAYLPKELKEQTDTVLKVLSQDPKLTELYKTWYDIRQKQQGFYNSKDINRVPIEQNNEFISIKNAIVREASRLKLMTTETTGFAVDDIIDLLCSFYCSSSDESRLDDTDIVEYQEDVDRALGIKHR